jgi:GTP cyclohydrolase I
VNRKLVEHHLSEAISKGLGLELSDPNLSGTPKRVAKMWVNEFFSSVGKKFCKLKLFPNDCGYDEVILMDGIYLVSTCSHHFLPFTGYAWFAYIPDKKFVGASKMGRIVIHHSQKPQLQEKLSHEILTDFTNRVKPLGAMLVMRAHHGCMSARGIKQSTIGMTTSAINGIFKDKPSIKHEVLDLIQIALHC